MILMLWKKRLCVGKHASSTVKHGIYMRVDYDVYIFYNGTGTTTEFFVHFQA